MSDVIKLLPDSVANQIAAGEVIQRPASVVKELVENAVDAGATSIKLFIKDAGRTLIQVVDNGKGMTETDARMAFERHATSKIREASDLFSLHTMGFRGEALPSICAISQVELKTKTTDKPIGTHLIINGSRVEQQQPVVCDAGTNIMVKNLFFNVPARRKFLKSDNVELSNIMREFERLALVNNNIRMSIDTGGRQLDLRAATFHQRIIDLWKNSLDLHLVPINVDTSLIKISGYVSRPEYARRRNPLQYLIVNGRNMRHPYFHKAILSCYESLIAPDTQPCYFLKFEVDPSSIDVNIHPTKNEIKFEYEQDIWPILQASVKAALGKSGSVPSIDFNIDVVPVAPVKQGESRPQPTIEIPKDYNPFKGVENPINHANTFRPANHDKSNAKNWNKLYSDFIKGAHDFGEETKASTENSTLEGFGSLMPDVICLQYKDRYIVTSGHDGLLIIDQRRAHIRILFDEFIEKLESGEVTSQGVMFPDSLEIEPSLHNALQEVLPEMNRIGFRIEYDSDNKWLVTGVPSFAINLDARDIILRMLEAVDETGLNYGNSHSSLNPLMQRLALIMARSAAIHYDQKLTSEEMEYIVSKLFSAPDSSYTPNGNKIYYLIEDSIINNILR